MHRTRPVAPGRERSVRDPTTELSAFDLTGVSSKPYFRTTARLATAEGVPMTEFDQALHPADAEGYLKSR